MKFEQSDGGRAKAGFKGRTRDCFTRALAILIGCSYKAAFDFVNARCGWKGRRNESASKGVHTDTAKRIMEELGWKWIPTMRVGQGCKVHLRDGELPPNDLLLVRLSGHYAAVVSGTIHDTADPSRGGQRCVYGYWIQKSGAALNMIAAGLLR